MCHTAITKSEKKVRAPSVPDEADEDNYRSTEQEDPIELSHSFFSNTKRNFFHFIHKDILTSSINPQNPTTYNKKGAHIPMLRK